jgi:hypothetical protein
VHDARNGSLGFQEPTKLLDHGAGGIPAVNNHRQVQLAGNVQMSFQNRSLFSKIIGLEEVQAGLPDGDDLGIGLGQGDNLCR